MEIDVSKSRTFSVGDVDTEKYTLYGPRAIIGSGGSGDGLPPPGPPGMLQDNLIFAS